MRIFVSYKREDQPFAERLASALENIGHYLWIDLDDIPAGQKWSDAIQEGLDAADVMLLVTTPESIASENVADEWQYFHSRKKPIIPIWLRPTEMPFQLDRLQRVDFTGDFDSGFSKLSIELASISSVAPPALEQEPRKPPVQPFLIALFTVSVLIAIVVGAVIFSQRSAGEDTPAPTTAPSQPTAGNAPLNMATALPSQTRGDAPTELPEATSTTPPEGNLTPIEFVTVAQYAEFLNGRPFPPDRRDQSGNLLLDFESTLVFLNNTNQLWEYDEQASYSSLTQVTWYGAIAYCSALNLVLPSENDIDLSGSTLEWLADGQIAGRGAIENAAKTFASSNISFRCLEK